MPVCSLWVLFKRRNKHCEFFLIRCKYSQRAANQFLRWLEKRLNNPVHWARESYTQGHISGCKTPGMTFSTLATFDLCMPCSLHSISNMLCLWKGKSQGWWNGPDWLFCKVHQMFLLFRKLSSYIKRTKRSTVKLWTKSATVNFVLATPAVRSCGCDTCRNRNCYASFHFGILITHIYQS